ncbi:protein C19orf12 homolog [Hydra vulgaris]|uniref:protein C19orf12 homolog n=1 Tax=Hydra vulgaris TaxID=6087 RepID=UPI0001925A45|nr:protein C19orf12 homolog [Hydra vulgaris]
MPISKEDVLRVLSHISDVDELKVTIQGSFFGSLTIAIFAMIFSLLLGPIGLLFGGIGGSIYAYNSYRGSYKPLSAVIRQLTNEQKSLLFSELEKTCSQITVSDYMELLLLLQGGSGIILKNQMFDILRSFMKKNLNLNIQ